MLTDIRLIARGLIQKPGFTVAAVLTLALGIGVTTAMFGFLDAIVLKDLDYPHSNELVYIYETRLNGKSNPSPLTYFEWKRLNTVFTQVSAIGSPISINIGSDAGAERILGRPVSADYFDMLGVRSVLGPGFQTGNDQIGNDQVVLLSNRLWRRVFGSDPAISGKSIQLNQKAYRVAGVLPEGGIFDRLPEELWFPQTIRPDQMRRNTQFFNAWARLKPGVSLAQADHEMKKMAAALGEQDGSRKDYSVSVVPLKETFIKDDTRSAVTILTTAVLFVLLIAIVNVANLLLVRGSSRQKEIAIRAALGAARLRLIKELLLESILIALLAGALGSWIGSRLMNVAAALLPSGTIPAQIAVTLDARVLLFAFIVSMLTGIAFGIIPAVQTGKISLTGALQEHGQSVSRRSGSLQSRLLLVGEIALTFILVVGATLMIRSFGRLLQIDPGFQRDNILTFRATLPAAKYPQTPDIMGYQTVMLERIRTMPGVKTAAASNTLPMAQNAFHNDFRVIGRAQGANERGNAAINATGSEFIETMGIRLLRGRSLSELDMTSPQPVALISQSLATRFFADSDPIGQQIEIMGMKAFEVVGVMSDIRRAGLDAPVQLEIYIPPSQLSEPLFSFGGRTVIFAVRTSGDAASLSGTIQSLGKTIDKDQPLWAFKTMEEVVSDSVATPRLRVVVFGVFGALALLLAAVGIYGVMAYSTTRRTQEIGIRMALGARPANVFRSIIAEGMMLALAGLVIGITGSIGLTRFVKSLLFGITSTDPLTFALAIVVVTGIAFLACVIPAQRAMRVDPLIAMRYE